MTLITLALNVWRKNGSDTQIGARCELCNPNICRESHKPERRQSKSKNK